MYCIRRYQSIKIEIEFKSSRQSVEVYHQASVVARERELKKVKDIFRREARIFYLNLYHPGFAVCTTRGIVVNGGKPPNPVSHIYHGN